MTDDRAAKIKQAAKLISERNAAKLKFLIADPTIDVNVSRVERLCDRKAVERDLGRMNEAQLDDLIESYQPSGPQYVWLDPQSPRSRIRVAGSHAPAGLQGRCLPCLSGSRPAAPRYGVHGWSHS